MPLLVFIVPKFESHSRFRPFNPSCLICISVGIATQAYQPRQTISPTSIISAVDLAGIDVGLTLVSAGGSTVNTDDPDADENGGE